MRINSFFSLLILAAAVMGCSWLKGPSAGDPAVNANSSAPAANGSAAAPSAGAGFTPGGDAKEDIFKAYDTFMKTPSFRAVMKGSGKSPVATTVEFIAPDSYHIRSGTDGQEMISVGKKFYMKMNGNWTEMPAGLGGLIPDMRKSFDSEARKWVSDVKFAGEDTLDGKAVYKYSFHAKGVNNIGENDSIAYIDKASGLPVRIEAKYVKGELKSMDIDYEYPTDIQIEAPKK